MLGDLSRIEASELQRILELILAKELRDYDRTEIDQINRELQLRTGRSRTEAETDLTP